MRALTKVNMVAKIFRIRIHILSKYSISILSFIKMYCQSMAYTETKSRAYQSRYFNKENKYARILEF